MVVLLSSGRHPLRDPGVEQQAQDPPPAPLGLRGPGPGAAHPQDVVAPWSGHHTPPWCRCSGACAANARSPPAHPLGPASLVRSGAVNWSRRVSEKRWIVITLSGSSTSAI